jgi:PhzF family phenazine biosynthesis protein
MQEIAKKINFSETAFVSKTNFADYKVRFFTPTSEVDLCGHATIATFFLMSKINLIKK